MSAAATAAGSQASRRVRTLVQRNADGSVTVRSFWKLPGIDGGECALAFTFHPCGRVETNLTYDPAEGAGDMPVFGAGFKMDADFDRMRYYGLGPDENYTDRKEGARLGVFV